MNTEISNILIVDDNCFIRKSLKQLLAISGYIVNTSDSGANALELMEKKKYDMVVSDIVMEGINGIELLKQIKEKYPHLPVLLISAYPSLDTSIEALRLGAFDYIKKPIDYNEILFKIRNALEAGRLRQKRDKERKEKEILLKQIKRHNISLERKVKEKNGSLERSRKDLEISEKKYISLIENSPDIIYVLNPEGHFSFVGGAVESLLGFTATEMAGRHFTSIVFPEDLEKAKYHLNDRRTEDRSTKGLELRLTVNSGKDKFFDIRYLPVDLNAFGMYDRPVSEKDKTFLGTYGVARDISLRKKAEQRLENSLDKLNQERQQKELLSGQLIDLLERERHQLAMDLHDDIGQNLASIKMGAEMILEKARENDEELVEDITFLKDSAIQIMKKVKDFSYGLRPSMLDKLGLIPSLDALFNDIEQSTGIKIHFFSKNLPKRLAIEKEIAFFRIIQESLANIIKHASAKQVFVNLIKNKKSLSLTVEDDGIGFVPKMVLNGSKEKGPLGLLIMRERAEQLGGKLIIESRIGRGALLLVEIPL